MTTLTLTAIILVVYLFGMMFIGWLGRGTSQNFEEFATAAKKGSLLMVTGSYLGSHIGSGVVVGGAENGALYGIGGVWYGLGACLSYIVFAIVVAKKLYRSNSLTLSECLDKRYGGSITGTFFALINCGAAISIMAGQIVAGRNLFEYIGVNPVIGAIACVVVVMIYASMSGQWGVMMTDVIQTAVVFFCTLVAVFWIFSADGFSLMESVLPATDFQFFSMDMNTIVMNAVPTILFGMVSASAFQRNISCKDEKTAVRSAALGGIILIPYVFLPVLIGMYGRALFPDAPAGTIIFQVMLEVMPPVVGALMVAALCAAVMSTVDSQLIYVSTSITKDIYMKFIDHNPDNKKMETLARIITVIAGALTLIVALRAGTIISLLSYAYTFLCAGTLVMFVGGLFWKKGTKAGAIASSITGMLFVVLYRFCGVDLPFESVFPILPAAIVYVVVSLCTQPKTLQAAK